MLPALPSTDQQQPVTTASNGLPNEVGPVFRHIHYSLIIMTYYIYLYIYLFIYLFTNVFIYLFIYLFIHLFYFILIFLFICKMYRKRQRLVLTENYVDQRILKTVG